VESIVPLLSFSFFHLTLAIFVSTRSKEQNAAKYSSFNNFVVLKAKFFFIRFLATRIAGNRGSRFESKRRRKNMDLSEWKILENSLLCNMGKETLEGERQCCPSADHDGVQERKDCSSIYS